LPLSSTFVTRFFQLVRKRQFAEAERILERLKLKTRKNERNRGYLQALYGIFLASKSNNDQYLFLSNINLKDKSELEKYRREFLKHTRDSLHAEYDRGFFSAWADYTRILLKLIKSEERSVQGKPKQAVGAEPKQVVTKKTKKIIQARLG
jgi:hypothetical protein